MKSLVQPSWMITYIFFYYETSSHYFFAFLKQRVVYHLRKLKIYTQHDLLSPLPRFGFPKLTTYVDVVKKVHGTNYVGREATIISLQFVLCTFKGHLGGSHSNSGKNAHSKVLKDKHVCKCKVYLYVNQRSFSLSMIKKINFP